MGKKSGSIFSQRLDRAVFVAYFLGAVVPFLALAFSVHRYVLPAIGTDEYLSAAMLGMVIGVGVLSLSAFFALRRLTGTALEKMNQDNHRLNTILSASQELSSSLHVQAVAETTVSCARTLTNSDAAYVVMSSGSGKPLVLTAVSGQNAQAIYQANEDMLLDLIESCVSSGEMSILSNQERPSKAADGEALILTAAGAQPLSVDGSSSAALVVAHVSGRASFGREECDALSTLTALTSVALHNAGLQDSQRNFFAHITELLVNALDSHVTNRGNHAKVVAMVVNRIAHEISLSEHRMQDLHFAALLHDIGMLRIEAKLQRSPAHYPKHPVIGHRMLSRIRLWERVAPIVLHHHEWFDGSGYPEAVVGEEIPLESRIIALADRLDVLTRNEPHRLALSLQEALGQIREASGTQFDPELVEALCRVASRGELELPSR